MTNQEIEALFKRLIADLGAVQAMNLANNFILMEAVSDLAGLSKDPQKYIAGMFERISARADQDAIEKEAHPVNAEFRRIISTFFSVAATPRPPKKSDP